MIPLWMALLALAWDFDRTVPAPSFLVILESVATITGVQHLLAAGVVPGTCARLPGADQDDFCVTLLCPGPGTFRVTVDALPWRSRSNTVQFRVLDAACTRLEGVIVGPGSLAGVPPASQCRSPIPVVVPPVLVERPTMETVTVLIPVPHTVPPVIPTNPNVVPKVPHAPGTVPGPTPGQVAQVPRVPTEAPPALVVQLPTGPGTLINVPPPAVNPPGVPCPQ